MYPTKRLVPLFALLSAPSLLTAAELTLASPFGDHMVLQQDMPVPVWGWADPGEVVTVEFAGQKKSATTDAAGNWRITLDPMTASAEPREFVVGSHRIADVLVGEVWICGGQSNMERELGLRSGQKPIIGWEEAAARADYPWLRQFYVPHRTADNPERTTKGSWTVCSPATAHEITAVGFFFARAMQAARPGVPIGLLHTSYGGTPAEAWTSAAGLARFPEFAGSMPGAQHPVDRERAHREYLEKSEAWFRTHEAGTREQWWKPGRDRTDWETMHQPVLWEEAGHPDWDGVAWYCRIVELPAAWSDRDLTLNLSAIDDVDTTWVNGVEVGTTAFYSAQRTYRVPASALKPGGNEIVVRVLDTGGGGGIWEPKLKLDLAPADGSATAMSLAGPWQVKFSIALDARGLPPPPQAPVIGGPGRPTVLYNAMLAPLAPYAIRGATFYQGEANNNRAVQYRKLLPAMIADWRRAWGQGDFPFLFVQIAPFNGMSPEIREAQLLAWQETKNTAMVVTLDVGDATDIHPANKRPVGERLARAARATVYGEKLEYSGPVFANATFADGRATVAFTHLGGGLVAPGGELAGFTLAGADGEFHPAHAEIVGDTVVVSAAPVAQPVAVRYAWAATPSGSNLFNGAGLPASSFRSDGPK